MTGNKFTAAAPSLGYLYQCRYALYLLLNRGKQDVDAQIAIEKFDDISFEDHGTPTEFIQVKHHLGTPPDLRDTSTDLWKTLRVWAEEFKAGRIVHGVFLSIVTTATASSESAAYLLKDTPARDSSKACDLLIAAAERMTGATLASARAAFQGLTDAKRREMVNMIHVVDAAPDIIDIQSRIKETLGFPVRTEHMVAFQERLEGWWFSQVIERLSGRTKTPISSVAVGRAMDDLRDSFRADSLPIDFRGFKPTLLPEENDRIFVKQLRFIALSDKRINWARIDYFRAFSQRSQWLNDNLIALPQIEEYDNVLTEEWEREFDRLAEEAQDKEDPQVTVRRGLTLYEHLQRSHRSIRPGCTEPYVGRGSYHMLAERKVVGWHGNFHILLDAVTDEQESGE